METTYPSKRDLWLTAIIGLSAALSLAAAVVIWFQPAGLGQRLGLGTFFVVTGLFTFDLLVRTDYTLTMDHLQVRCGWLKWRVPYHAIVSIRPGRTLISGPALSLDRLTVTRSDSRLPLVISPADRERFLQDLADRDAELQLEDGRVDRRAS